MIFSRSLAAIASIFSLSLQAADLSLVDDSVIVFAGDSIPQLQMYPHYVAAYLVLMNPSLTLHCLNETRSGQSIANQLDSAGSGYKHYTRRVWALEPDVCFVQTSTNSSPTKAAHKTAMTTLVGYPLSQGAFVVMLGTSPDSTTTGTALSGDYDDADDEIVTALADPNLINHKTWQALQPRFTEYKSFTVDSGTDVCTATGHTFLDGDPIIFALSSSPVGHSGVSNGVRYYVRDVATNTFKVAATSGGTALNLTSGSGNNYASVIWSMVRRDDYQNDTHPGKAANIAYAWKVMTGLGWTSAVSSATIAADTTTVTSETQCDVAAVTANAYTGIDFTRLDNRLPWAFDEDGRTNADYIYPGCTTWQSYTQTITGLTSGTYDIYIDGEVVASKTHTQLAAGWNMAELTSGPVYTKGQTVLALLRAENDVASTYPFAKAHTGTDRVGLEKYRGVADTAFSNLLATYPSTWADHKADLIADAGIGTALRRTNRTVTANTGTNVITDAGHSMINGWRVRFTTTGTLPSPLAAGTDYYIVQKAVGNYKVSLTSGGTAVTLATTGSGTHSIYRMDNIADLSEEVRLAAQPTTLTFSIRKQGGGGGTPAAGRTNKRRKTGTSVIP